MKICTVNVPESYVEAIKKLVGEEGLYPSRSELIRCAVRDFLIKELALARNTSRRTKPEPEEALDESTFVRIPIDSVDENDELIRDFKTYKIVRKLI